MKKIIFAIYSVAIIFSTKEVSGEAGTPTYKNCYSLNHKKRETDTKVSFNQNATQQWQIVGFYDTDGNGVLGTPGDTPIWGWATLPAGWYEMDKDHDGACNKNSAHCQSSTTQSISGTNYTAIAEAWNNYSQGTAISQVIPHSRLKAGADDNTPNPYETVSGLSSSHAEYDNDIFDDYAIFKLKGGFLEASRDFFTNLKVIVCIRNSNGEIKEIINESELLINDNGITKTGIFSTIQNYEYFVNENGNNYLILPQTGEFNIPIPAQYADNEDICIYVVTDGGYRNTYVQNKKSSIVQEIGNEVTTYPNPVFDGAITIKLSDIFANTNNTITVTDVSGKTILKTTYSNTTLVNLNNLPKGVLIIEISNTENIIIKKVISQ